MTAHWLLILVVALCCLLAVAPSASAVWCMAALASGAKIGDQRTLSSLQRTAAMVAGQGLR
jgi:hypothetical protein